MGPITSKEVIEFMGGKCELEQTVVDTRKEFLCPSGEQFEFDFSDVRGQGKM